MKKHHKYAFLIFLPAFILLALFFFQASFIRLLAIRSIQKYTEEHLQANISWKDTLMTQNGWIWKGISLTDQNTHEILASSKELQINPSFSLLSFDISYDIEGSLQLPSPSQDYSIFINIQYKNENLTGEARCLLTQDSSIEISFDQSICVNFSQVNGLQLIELPLLKKFSLDSTLFHRFLNGKIILQKNSSTLKLSYADLLLHDPTGNLSHFTFSHPEILDAPQFSLNFGENFLKISGEGEITADYSKKRLVLTGLFESIKAENNFISLENPHALSRAVYYIDLVNGDHGGSLSLKEAVLHEKIHDLFFNKIPL